MMTSTRAFPHTTTTTTSDRQYNRRNASSNDGSRERNEVSFIFELLTGIVHIEMNTTEIRDTKI